MKRVRTSIATIAIAAALDLGGGAALAIPGVPEPGILLYGTVTNINDGSAVAISSVSWVIDDGTVTFPITAATRPGTQIVSHEGQSFYTVEIPFDTREVGSGPGTVVFDPPVPPGFSFQLLPESPSYTCTPSVNGARTTIASITPALGGGVGTSSYTFDDFTAPERGRAVRVDLFVDVETYADWAAGFFADVNADEAQPDADPDGDGRTNRQERADSTNPLDPASVLRILSIERIPGDAVRLMWTSISGKPYAIESSVDLDSEIWDEVSTHPGDPDITVLELPVPPGVGRVFFRLRTSP